MNINHYNLKPIPNTNSAWQLAWYGYYRLYDQVKVELEATAKERQIEIDCFLSILNNIKNDNVKVLEIGSGWGEWCLATAGVINNKLFGVKNKSYECYAIEADPDNRFLTEKHFDKHDIKGFVEWGAIADKVGTCFFNINGIPFGQSMTFHGMIQGSNFAAKLWGLYRMLLGKVTVVPQITIDWFLERYDIKHVDLMQMDIQGAEVKAIKGAIRSIAENKIDYFMIGTHHKKIHRQLFDLLNNDYDLILDVYPKSPVCPVDGLQAYKRKGL